jgi:hypothetical protein
VVWFGISPVQVDVWWHGFGKSLEIVIVVVRFFKSLEDVSACGGVVESRYGLM